MLDQFALTMKRNALQFHAGHAMFCPSCQTILDCRRAVEIDASKDGKLITSKIVCASCYDSHVRVNLIDAKLPEGVTVEVNDGRVLFAKPKATKRAKKAPKAAQPVAVEQLPLTA